MIERLPVPDNLRVHARRLIRFGVVGATGVVVNYLLLYTLVEFAGMPSLVAAAIATEASILSNFALNNVWTFRDVANDTSLPSRALRYNLFALGGLVISVAVLGLLTYGFGIHYLIANLFAIAAATLWNYAANARWTWGTTKPQSVAGRDRVQSDIWAD